MKLPIILSAMIAALAIPGSLASEQTTEAATTTETAPEATTPEATPEATPPVAEEHHEAAHAAKKGDAHHPGKSGKRRSMKRHHHHEGHHHTGNSPQGPYKGSYDDMHLRGADGDVNADRSPRAGAEVAPGHKAP